MPPLSKSPPVIVWFRQDLRVVDHPALSAAVQSGAPVIPLFVLEDEAPANWTPGAASRWWLEGSLSALDTDLRARGSRLILRRGKALEVLAQVAAKTGASGVYFTRHYEPRLSAEESAIAEEFEQQRLMCRRFDGGLLFEPEAVRTRTGGPFRVFTPFYKACLAIKGIKDPLPGPDRIKTPPTWPDSEPLKNWRLRPSAPDWAKGLRDYWKPGSDEASARLDSFLENGLSTYPENRDRPDRPGTSTLSPYLHFGEISPRQVWHRARLWADVHADAGRDSTTYLRELIWREFSYHLLHHFPGIVEAPFNPGFSDFPWRQDAQALKAWQRGLTGYPIVDAGMRQLWRTGWMHNRVRMIVASFLTKHLLIPWQEGARWFWDTLVDADLANNSASWQWVAGCGADAAPYYRIFNPILQGRKFAPSGAYVRKWIPEIADLPDRVIHTPWESGIPVDSYPQPIVDHGFARQRALDIYKKFRIDSAR
jgi:deoxyribodipyrimidine photo-lyase